MTSCTECGSLLCPDCRTPLHPTWVWKTVRVKKKRHIVYLMTCQRDECPFVSIEAYRSPNGFVSTGEPERIDPNDDDWLAQQW